MKSLAMDLAVYVEIFFDFVHTIANDWLVRLVPKMTSCYLSSGTLNSTQSLTLDRTDLQTDGQTDGTVAIGDRQCLCVF